MDKHTPAKTKKSYTPCDQCGRGTTYPQAFQYGPVSQLLLCPTCYRARVAIAKSEPAFPRYE